MSSPGGEEHPTGDAHRTPPSIRRVLVSRRFLPFFAGSALSNIGTWFQNIAAGLLIYQLTGSSLLVGTVHFAQFIGAFLLVPLGELTSGLVRTPPEFLSFLAGRAGLDLMLYGGLIVLIIMFLPKGVYGSLTHRIAVRRQRRQRERVAA